MFHGSELTGFDVSVSQEEMKMCVERGVALLDRKKPGWEQRIDLDRLKLASLGDCILGQLYVFYVTGLVSLFDDMIVSQSVSHGFSLSGPFTGMEWNVLTQVWIDVIRERR